MVGLHNCSGTVKFTCICLQARKVREVVACKNSCFSSFCFSCFWLVATGMFCEEETKCKMSPAAMSEEKQLFSQATIFLVELFSVGIMGDQRNFSFESRKDLLHQCVFKQLLGFMSDSCFF